MFNARPHQAAAISDILSSFQDCPSAQCIMPCGAGKTLVQAEVAKQGEFRRILSIQPTLALTSQNMDKWRNQFPEAQPLAFCSKLTSARRTRSAQR